MRSSPRVFKKGAKREIMKVRVWNKLHDDLEGMAARYNVRSMSDISRRACRKFNNQDKKKQGEILKFGEPSTYKGPEMLFNIPDDLRGDKTAADLRKILVWYMQDQQKKARPVAPLELDEYDGEIEFINSENYTRKVHKVNR